MAFVTVRNFEILIDPCYTCLTIFQARAFETGQRTVLGIGIAFLLEAVNDFNEFALSVSKSNLKGYEFCTRALLLLLVLYCLWYYLDNGIPFYYSLFYSSEL